MKYLIILLISMLFNTLSAQYKYDYTWVLGYDTDLGIPGGEGILMKFMDGEVTVDFLEKNMEMHTDNGTMSDEDGNLLFYTNGCFIANKEHEVMENGSGINPGNFHNNYCAHGYPVQQGVLILPAPGKTDQYYIFHNRYHFQGQFADILYYSLINMTESDGLGAVIEKNVPVLEDSLWVGYLTAVKHTNNEDWWIVTGGFKSGEYHTLLLDSNGVAPVGEQDFNLGIEGGGWGACQAAFSPDGTKYIHYNRNEQVLLSDFDRSTGEFSNPQQLFIADTVYFGGVAVSPDSRFLYVSNAIFLYQFDLQAPDIQASKVVIDTFDGFSSPFPANFYLMQLGPDCRIYMSTGNGADRLHVINYPNRKGKDCDFQQHAIKLPQSNASTIPNNPNYRLGTPYPVCDSTIQMVVSSVEVLPPVREVAVYPNPAANEVTIQFSSGMEKMTREVALFAVSGREMFRQKIPEESIQYTLNTVTIPEGIYFIAIFENGKKVNTEKIIILK